MRRGVAILAAIVATGLCAGGTAAWAFLFDSVEQPAVFSMAGPAELIGVSAERVDLGELHEGTRRTVPRAFAVTGGALLTGPATFGLRAAGGAATPAFGSGSATATRTLGAGEERRVDLTLDLSGLPAGPHATDIVVEAQLPGGARVERTVTVVLVVKAQGKPKAAPVEADAPAAAPEERRAAEPAPGAVGSDAPAPGAVGPDAPAPAPAAGPEPAEPEPAPAAPEPTVPAPVVPAPTTPEPAPAAPLDPQLADA